MLSAGREPVFLMHKFKGGNHNSAIIKWILLVVLFCAFVVFLIFSNRNPINVQQDETAVTAIETPLQQEISSAPAVTVPAAEEMEETETTTMWILPEKETGTISYEGLETEDPQERMTTVGMIEDGIIRNGELQIDVSAVEKELRKGELYSLSDTIKRYLAEKTGEDISGKAELISCTTKENSDEKTMTVFFRFGKTMYEAKKNLTKSTSEFAVIEHSNGKK